MSVATVLSETRSRFTRVDAEVAHRLHLSGATLVDIRPIHQRVEYGEVPGSIIIERNVLEWRFDPHSEARLPHIDGPGHRVVVLCQQGYASSLAAASLIDVGLPLATDLIGGFESWRSKGLPTVNGGTPSGLWVTPRATQR